MRLKVLLNEMQTLVESVFTKEDLKKSKENLKKALRVLQQNGVKIKTEGEDEKIAVDPKGRNIGKLIPAELRNGKSGVYVRKYDDGKTGIYSKVDDCIMCGHIMKHSDLYNGYCPECN